MNVQPMTLDMNMLRAPQKANNQQANSKKEDDFSYVLDRSRQKQEKPIKQKTNKSNETNQQKVDKNPETESKKTESKGAIEVKDVKQVKEITEEDEVLFKDEIDKAMSDLANLFGIGVEELEQMLVNLQIGLSDLLQVDNLQQLIMEVNGVDQPMELLLIPELGVTIKEITAIVENYTSNITNLGFDTKLLEAEQGQIENVIKPEMQGVNIANQNNITQDTQLGANNEGLGAKMETMTQIEAVGQNSEELAQNEEQSTPNQNKAANQFLDNLSQSMGEVFQSQNNPITEAFETVATRTEPVNPRMVLDQIVEKIKVSSIENEAKMTIQLKPEHLGKLNMEVVSKQGILTAQITVENEKTKALLDQNIQSLREGLESKGLVIQELEVAVGQNQNEDRPAYEGSKQNKNMSDIINQMMSEDGEMVEEAQSDNLFDDTNEVDYIA